MTTKPKLEEIEEMTSDIKDGLTGANNPSASNVYATIADIPAGTESFSVGFGGQFLSNTSDITPEKVSAGAIVAFDLESNWDVGSTRYVVPEDGVYFFAFSIASAGPRVDGDLQSLLYVDGIGASGGSTGPAGGSGGAVSNGTALLQLTAGQLVELYGSSSSSAGESVSGKIEGYRIA